MSNSNQLGSFWIGNFVQFNFREYDYLSGEEVDGMKRQQVFLGSDRRLYMVPVFLLEVSDRLKCREEFDWLAEDVGES